MPFSTAINGDLSGYQVLVLDIYDFATLGATEASSLETFAVAGGRILATGFDSARSISWGTALHPVLGNTAGAASDVSTSPNIVTTEANSLTTGLVDIRGYSFLTVENDYDQLDGPFTSETAIVMSNTGGGAMWTLRTLPSGGQVAYLSSTLAFDYASNAAYAGALRNFVGTAVPEPSTAALLFSGVSLSLFTRRRKSNLKDSW